jgi:hypothetical protein
MRLTDYITPGKISQMQNGAELFLQRWNDLFHRGLQELLTDATPLLDMAEQQVDCGNGNIARQIRLVHRELSAESDPYWMERISQCLISAQALVRLDHFTVLQQLDILVQCGLRQQKKTLSPHGSKRSSWLVLHHATQTVENLIQTTTYFQSLENQSFGLDLQYRHLREKPKGPRRQVGQIIDLESVFYPSAHPLRLHVIQEFSARRGAGHSGFASWDQWQKYNITRIRTAPWLTHRPAILQQLIATQDRGQPALRDTKSTSALYLASETDALTFWAFSEGLPIDIFGIGHSGHFEVHTLIRQDTYLPLSRPLLLRNVSNHSLDQN